MGDCGFSSDEEDPFGDVFSNDFQLESVLGDLSVEEVPPKRKRKGREVDLLEHLPEDDGPIAHNTRSKRRKLSNLQKETSFEVQVSIFTISLF